MDGIPVELGLYLDQVQRQSEQNLGWMKVRLQHSSDGESVALADFGQTFSDRVTQLSRLYRDACRDLERERIAGRVAQEQAEIIDEKLRVLEDSAARSAFVLVLIDADTDAYLVWPPIYKLAVVM